MSSFIIHHQSDYNVRFAVKKSESEIFSGGLVLGNVNVNANCRFRIAENESICVFEIATFSADKQENLFNNQIVMIKYGEDYLIAYQIIADASAAKADALSQGFINNTRIINRLPYCHTFNNIEIIESKVIVGNTDYLDKITKIFDCSNISAQNQYTFNGKNYYAINTNTLMEV